MNEKMGRSRAGGRVLSTIGRIFLILLIIVFSIGCLYGYKILKIKQDENIKKSQQVENLKNDIKMAEDKKNELSKTKDRVVSDEEYESMARDELGLIKKDEILIKPR